jgi:hypothetical protein
LYGVGADAAGGAVDQYGLAGLGVDRVDRGGCGGTGQGDRGGGDEVQLGRLSDDRGGGQ